MPEEYSNEERLQTVETIKRAGISPTAALSHLTQDVRVFHLLFGHPAPEKPVVQPPELVARRIKWMESEIDELREAATIYEQADAYLDIIYFAVGGLVEMGIKFTHRLWRLVQGANIAKVWPDGSVRKNEHGKVQKPEGWQAPDAAIAMAIDEEVHGSAEADLTGGTLISSVGDEVVQRLSLAFGGHTHVLLFAIAPDGCVESTSNLDIHNQRDFLRYVYQSFANGDVVVEAEGMTKQ